MCSQEIGSDGRPQAICDTCKYRVLRAWKNRDDSAAALKQKHPVSHKDHNSVILHELSKVIDLNITKNSEACSQTSICHCATSARNKTYVKVCMYYYYYLFEYKWRRIKKMESLKNIAKITRSQLNKE